MNGKYKLWEEAFFGVPQSSTLRPLLFNVFLRKLFMFTDHIDIASYADD